MAATPQYGTMVFRGLRTGKTYVKDLYVSDVLAALITFDAGGGAGAATPTAWKAPEPLILVDYAQVTGTQDTTKLQVTRNGVPTGDMLRYSIHLTSLNNRPALSIGFGQGVDVGAIQR